jgi:hypothetical protein
MSQSVNRKRALDWVREWDLHFPIGTTVELNGEDGRRITTKTESHAGLGERDEPSVFVEGIETPVSILRLVVPGWEWERKSNKRTRR